ncbi:hypothetical protein F5051DRAFT_337723 [Lentinula edodes]|nr:hypothetical protein F5051DRAFT_337723 [Lentinula edodes]
MKLHSWNNPANDFAYSRGPPRGYYKGTHEVPLLVDQETGFMVPCTVRHSTCTKHSSATREKLQERLQEDRKLRLEFSSPARDLFQHTSAFIIALKHSGCSANIVLGLQEQLMEDPNVMHMRRGYPLKENQCNGKIIFGYSFDNEPFLKCEHYSNQERDHFFDGTFGNGSYHLEYLEAVITDDKEEVVRIEAEVEMNGYGPRTACHTIMNHSSQRPVCPFNHRDEQDGALKQLKMELCGCSCIYREYEPLEQYHRVCPYVLIVSKGPHTHPIPLPEKTPAAVKTELNTLIRKLDVDMADITPRQFLRHPIVKSYLRSRFPLLHNPMLSDLHISLSNRSHLKVYIDVIKAVDFPFGTGWKGLQYLKTQQDLILPPEDWYIRRLVEIPASLLKDDSDDVPEDESVSKTDALRIVICMTSETSQRFITAQHLQSDIGFKRVIGYYEFEVAAVDPDSNTSITYCRVFLTRQTAFAHLQVLREIDGVLKDDTGRTLHWRHIHGDRIDDYEGNILNWVVDQHGSQAKGIGLYLEELAKSLPLKMDFHRPSCSIQSLGPYDHLRRFLTLCTTHFSRNICKCAVSEEVRNLMRSLVCIRHDDWEGTLELIEEQGGKAGQNWVADKVRTKFAFPGICWERSYIPLEIWNARRRDSNIAEIVHADINREGVRCTLVGGVQKGQHFDQMKLAALKNCESMGVRDSYRSKNLFENATKNLNRRCRNYPLLLFSEDYKIEEHNKRMTDCWNKLNQARERTGARFRAAYPLGDLQHPASEQAQALYRKAQEQESKVKLAFEKQATLGRALVCVGTGKVKVRLPN